MCRRAAFQLGHLFPYVLVVHVAWTWKLSLRHGYISNMVASILHLSSDIEDNDSKFILSLMNGLWMCLY